MKLDNMAVRVTSPTDGSYVYGTVTLAASVTSSAAVAKVEFFVDGGLQSTDTTSPYTGSWETRSYTSGTTVLNTRVTARVTDVNGRTFTSAPITVYRRCLSNTYCAGNSSGY